MDSENLKNILKTHAGRYPEARPRDAVKLIYQNEFGGGHLIRDSAASFAALSQEYQEYNANKYTRDNIKNIKFEEIGNGVVRVYLSGIAKNITDESDRPDAYTLEKLNQDFIQSAKIHTGTRENFLRKLEILRELTGENIFHFHLSELDEYLTRYAAAGYPAVSHSDIYRAAYHPAYRIIDRKISLPLFIRQIWDLENKSKKNKSQSVILIAIDGCCASGKTTLAEKLSGYYGWSVVHLDDFFLRPSQRTPERYEEPGGNLDRERVLKEILIPLKSRELYQNPAISYRPFDCHAMRLKDPVLLKLSHVILIEGSYACHPALYDFYNLRVFLTIDQETQKTRIKRRNDPETAENFFNRWIPLEERYFSAFSIPKQCDYAINNN